MTRDPGYQAHERAVARLKASYDAIPPGAPVRLAKRTSNLFRARSQQDMPGLDVSGLRGVIEIDPRRLTADVQGMCSYEDLVDATLPFGLIPLVVPQLRSITLGGAVTGLGIESTSFRNGLPHESVLEMDVLTGAGSIVTTRPGDPLFDSFPNSYGSLGYATRLRIELEQVPAHVALRHVRFDDVEQAAKAIAEIAETREWAGTRVDGIDGTVFGPDECYLTLAEWSADAGPTSDYTGMQPYFTSLRERDSDKLTTYDYLWRWDTDWFWCSGAFGLHNPRIRRWWPRKYRRSDVYHRLVGLEQRHGIGRRLDRRKGLPERERVIQDIEVPVDRLVEFLRWFDAEVGMRPVWLCPLRLRGDKTWPSYPLQGGTTYVNVGFWGTVFVEPGGKDGDKNRAIEAKVSELGGHKSLYSDAFYDRETFDSLYGTANLRAVKGSYDPNDRLTGLYEKAVGNR
ncbi:MAG TPA: FAD-binding oxidoreductase, partial [Nocardioidaceae bacterium]|nr:FAD-binding oxidoreductase [Nocardioidaceae bacterium]